MFEYLMEAFQPTLEAPYGYYLDIPIGKIPRSKMPQLKPELSGQFLALYGVEQPFPRVNADKYKPSQGEIQEEKINKFTEDPELWKKVRDIPIYVSLDDFIIDGHHRALAAARLNDTVPVALLPMNANAALATMNLYHRLMVAEGKMEPGLN